MTLERAKYTAGKIVLVLLLLQHEYHLLLLGPNRQLQALAKDVLTIITSALSYCVSLLEVKKLKF